MSTLFLVILAIVIALAIFYAGAVAGAAKVKAAAGKAMTDFHAIEHTFTDKAKGFERVVRKRLRL